MHEYEFIYGAAIDGFTEDLSSPDTPGLTRIISPLRTLPITANIATAYSCGVLPLQNKQRVVADENMKIPANPVAGGFAGEAVQDQVLLQKVKAHVKVRRGMINGGGPGNEDWVVHFTDDTSGTSGTIAVGDGYLEGEYLEIDNTSSQNFKITRQSLHLVV